MSDFINKTISNYRLLRLLGSGGFGEVYLGEHLYLKMPAAIKILRSQMSVETFKLFLREARVLAQLDHPHIIRVLEFGVEGRTPYLITSFAPNGTLYQLYPEKSPISIPVVIQYTKQLASALQYAHDLHLLHRDIKPSNILLGRNHEAILSDFGLAVMAKGTYEEHTQYIAGTVSYMAPEQFQGITSQASDQYSLGIIVYELLSGSTPFKGTPSEIAAQHIQAPPPSLHEHIPDLPPTIERVLLKAIAKDPAQRYPRIEQFAQELEQAYLDDSQRHPKQKTVRLKRYHTQRSLAGLPVHTLSQGDTMLSPNAEAMYATARQQAGNTKQATTLTASSDKRRVVKRSLLALCLLFALALLGGGSLWYGHQIQFSSGALSKQAHTSSHAGSQKAGTTTQKGASAISITQVKDTPPFPSDSKPDVSNPASANSDTPVQKASASPSVPSVPPQGTPVPVPGIILPGGTPTPTPVVSPTPSPVLTPSPTPAVSPTVAPIIVPSASPTVAPIIVPSATPPTSPTLPPTALPSATPETPASNTTSMDSNNTAPTRQTSVLSQIITASMLSLRLEYPIINFL